MKRDGGAKKIKGSWCNTTLVKVPKENCTHEHGTGRNRNGSMSVKRYTHVER